MSALIEQPLAGTVPASQRGKLVMAAKVVEKITSQAASEVAAAGGTMGGILGIGTHVDLDARPKVAIELSGTTATADIAIGIAYPTPIKQATDRVRRHVIDRVQQLCGVEITRVDLMVTALPTRTARTPAALL